MYPVCRSRINVDAPDPYAGSPPRSHSCWATRTSPSDHRPAAANDRTGIPSAVGPDTNDRARRRKWPHRCTCPPDPDRRDHPRNRTASQTAGSAIPPAVPSARAYAVASRNRRNRKRPHRRCRPRGDSGPDCGTCARTEL